jgi:hypothetical protein
MLNNPWISDLEITDTEEPVHVHRGMGKGNPKYSSDEEDDNEDDDDDDDDEEDDDDEDEEYSDDE